ncbi:hypothetical protein DFH27DRAFT_509807 [Peziza echinospora]|nr:hypothetical protein DFH27DRAFT_509807 [Peziza echinospora]
MPPRIIRRKPLSSRILSWLNPIDYLADIYHYDWDGVSATTATPLAIGLNVFLLIARANGNAARPRSSRYGYDEVLRTPGGVVASGSKLGYFLWIISWVLALLSIVNGLLCFSKKKRYRMFESNIEVELSTPSAKRVNLNSSPGNLPSTILNSLTPQKPRDTGSRNAPTDEGPEVWEISVWDPTPLSLGLFHHFSPVHCAIYFLMFPLASSVSSTLSGTTSSASSSTSKITSYLTVFIIQTLLSLQLGKLISSFTQQAIDKALIQKEVFHEYDTKYVHPRTSTIKRDVGIQCSDDHFEAMVQVYTPTYNRLGYTIRPNPSYSPYTVVDASGAAYGGLAKSPIPERPVKREAGGFGTGTTPRARLFSDVGSVITPYEENTFSPRRRPLTATGNQAFPAAAAQNRQGAGTPVGMAGLVNMSVENSRSLSPSKMASPLKKGGRARGSSYAASLGMGLGAQGGPFFGAPRR